MQDFFNPAGLEVLDDGSGAVAFGLISARVLYARLVGTLSAELDNAYAARVERLLATRAPLACFEDASALRAQPASARARLLRSAFARAEQFASFVILIPKSNLPSWARSRAKSRTESLTLLSDPGEFELWLSNVAPSSPFGDSRELIALHAHGSETAPISGVRRVQTSPARTSLAPSEHRSLEEARRAG